VLAAFPSCLSSSARLSVSFFGIVFLPLVNVMPRGDWQDYSDLVIA
jgi:hypothetical protein